MSSAPHHHQVLHAATQTVAAHPAASLNTLPPWTHSPIFLTFAPCFIVLVLLMIRHRIKLDRRGERFTRRKTKPAEVIGGLLFGAALIYFQDKYPVIRQIMDWPYVHIPYFRDHHLEMWAGFLAAGLAASMISALYAALFLRGGNGSRGGNAVAIGMAARRHTLLPDPPAGYGWFSSPQTTQRITRQRTTHFEEGD